MKKIVKAVVGGCLNADRELALEIVRQTVVVEHLTHGGAKGLEANAMVLAIVLYLTELCGLRDTGVEHEAEAVVLRDTKDKDLWRLAFLTVLRGGSVGMSAHVVEKGVGKGYGVVGRVENDEERAATEIVDDTPVQSTGMQNKGVYVGYCFHDGKDTENALLGDFNFVVFVTGAEGYSLYVLKGREGEQRVTVTVRSSLGTEDEAAQLCTGGATG